MNHGSKVRCSRRLVAPLFAIAGVAAFGGCASLFERNANPWPRVEAERIPHPQPIIRTFGALYFELDRTDVDQQGRQLADRLVNHLKRHPKDQVRLEGHASTDGLAAYNWELSRLRAEAVKTHLVGLGVAADRIVVAGFGESDPAGSDEAANRRVEIIVVHMGR